MYSCRFRSCARLVTPLLALVILSFSTPVVAQVGVLPDRLPGTDGSCELDSIVLRDSFDSPTLDGWEFLNWGSRGGTGTWILSDGSLRQTSNTFSGNAWTARTLGTIATAGQDRWQNYRVSAQFNSDDNDAVGLVARLNNNGHHYLFTVDSQRRIARLVRFDGAWEYVEEPVAIDSYELGAWHDLVLEVDGPHIRATYNGQQVFDTEDGALRIGRPGLFTWANAGVSFDDFTVEDLDALRACDNPCTPEVLLTERFDAPPGLVDPNGSMPIGDAALGIEVLDFGNKGGASDWQLTADGTLIQNSDTFAGNGFTARALGTSAFFGDLSWRDYRITAKFRSADNDGVGLMARSNEAGHHYVFSVDKQRAIARLVRFTGASEWIAEPVAIEGYSLNEWHDIALEVEGVHIRAYFDGELLFDAEDDVLSAGRPGLYTWANRGVEFDDIVVVSTDSPADCGADVLFESDFSDESLEPFQVIDWGRDRAPSQWEVKGGVLAQQSDIHGGRHYLPRLLGTIAYVPSEEWSDYTVSTLFQNSDNDSVGLVGRYRSDHNHYVFTVDSQRAVARLSVFSSGKFEWIAEPLSIPSYALNTWHELSMTFDGPRITASLNGETLFDVTDDRVSSGGAGLFTWANRGAAFDDFRVIGPSEGESRSCRSDLDCEGDSVCFDTVCRPETLEFAQTWDLYAGAPEHVVDYLGGDDAIRRFVLAESPRARHIGFLGLPPVGFDYWAQVPERLLADSDENVPVQPDEVSIPLLLRQLEECGLRPFTVGELPDYDGLPAEIADQLGVEGWLLLSEQENVFTVVLFKKDETIDWISVTQLNSQFDGEQFSFSTVRPLTDPGYFLLNYSCAQSTSGH